MAKILKCDDCGSIIQVLVEDDGDTCDTHMLSIPVQTEGEKSPKHKPVVEIDGDKVTVKSVKQLTQWMMTITSSLLLLKLEQNNTQKALNLEMLQK